VPVNAASMGISARPMAMENAATGKIRNSVLKMCRFGRNMAVIVCEAGLNRGESKDAKQLEDENDRATANKRREAFGNFVPEFVIDGQARADRLFSLVFVNIFT